MKTALLLANCRLCDDIFKAVDTEPRSCECGGVTVELDDEGNAVIRGEHGRVIEIEWEHYDQMREGDPVRCRVALLNSERVKRK